jgi:hypothetical protein
LDDCTFLNQMQQPVAIGVGKNAGHEPDRSSSGVVWAFPTTKLPAPSTMKVSVIVPPASIASTRGSRSAIAHIAVPE